ncbi:MAG: aminopeptidase, partial [Promethearchaeota archaeon]
MVDSRIVEHARILVEYSTKVKPGEMVYIVADIEAHPLVVEVVKHVAKHSASSLVVMSSSELSR